MTCDDPGLAGAEGGLPLSVALVCPAWPRETFANGIIPYVADLAEGLRRDKHTVTVLALQSSEEVDGPDVVNVRPFGRYRGPATRMIDVLMSLSSRQARGRRIVTQALIANCRKLIDERGLQLVEIEESHGTALDLQRSLPIPVVVRLHGPWFVNGPLRGAVEDEGFRRQVALEGLAIRRASAVTSPSLEVLDRVRAFYGLPLEKAEVIPNPTSPLAEADRWTLEGSDGETILFVGRFDRHKGGDVVIDAFAELAKRRPKARLAFAGPDSGMVDAEGRRWSIAQYLDAKVPGASADGRVRWLGQLPPAALATLRKGARVAVVCSRYETFGLTLAESMAAGCPTVATRVGAFPELIVDGQNGLFCRSDDPNDLAEKLERLLSDDELSERLGRQAATDINARLNPFRIAAQTARFYRRVLGEWAGIGRGNAFR